MKSVESNRLQKFLLAVPVAGAGLGAATSADATIVNFDLTGHAGGGLSLSPGPGSYISFDFTSGTYALNKSLPSSALYLRTLTSAGNPFQTLQFVGNFGVLAGAGYNSVMINELALGTTIGAGSGTWKDHTSYGASSTSGVTWSAAYTSWTTPSTGYMGLRLDLTGGNYDYGWAKVDYHQTAGIVRFTDFAFETTANTAILAGDIGAVPVPEPTTSALRLLAAGVLGIAAYRRCRTTAPQALESKN